MIDAGSLIGALMKGGIEGVGGSRVASALGTGGPAGAGMGDMLSGLLGGSRGGSGGITDLLGGMLGANATGLGGAALGGVLGSMFGKSDGLGGIAKGGAVAMLGMLAVNAMKNYAAAQAPTADQRASMQLLSGQRQPETPQERQEIENVAQLTVQAMINAAKADGKVDEAEMGRIIGRLEQSGADAGDLAFVRKFLAAPMDTDAIVNAVNSPQVAAQVYAASLLAIQVDTQAEEAYLQELATRLGIDTETRSNIHRMLGL